MSSNIRAHQSKVEASRSTASDTHLGSEDEGYKKTLRLRQVQMIAIGGAIGSGLFMGGRAPCSSRTIAGSRLRDVWIFRLVDRSGAGRTGADRARLPGRDIYHRVRSLLRCGAGRRLISGTQSRQGHCKRRNDCQWTSRATRMRRAGIGVK